MNELRIGIDELRKKALEVKESGYTYFSFMTAVDNGSNLTLYYRLANLENNSEVWLVVENVPYGAEVPSLYDIFEGADWHERECYDLFGVKFSNHPNLKRILLPEDYEGHPLLKSFPIDAPYKDYRD
ncbi:NADH-quinone oxidoreductase subunit C [Candidatus Caldipriscus sp.]|jgi:NADH-quinone oxidoreductase subunit C|nr:NADH-quinone oxidoreductase subunit C [Candidatus Caldipriscus sp.]MDT7904002.1 NADH-quinone oxidoreductase subunit C [Candidatus Caldipriscus sp.]